MSWLVTIGTSTAAGAWMRHLVYASAVLSAFHVIAPLVPSTPLS